jgi:hypothetical protein
VLLTVPQVVVRLSSSSSSSSSSAVAAAAAEKTEGGGAGGGAGAGAAAAAGAGAAADAGGTIIRCDAVLSATGRVGATAHMNLEEIGLTLDRR